MDNISQISLCAIILPFLFMAYLLIKRLRYSIVKKPILNNGLILTNILSLIGFLVLLIKKSVLHIEYNFLNINKFNFNFGISLDEINLKFLCYSAFTFLLISIISKIYFVKKKQFYFTKQRFYIFLSCLIFNTYLFLVSATLFQMLIFWILQGVIIFCFSYFDIFKKSAGYNILRFHRISLSGDFCFILLCLILLKYTLLSQGYISESTLNLDELNVLYSYTYGIAGQSDLILILAAILLTSASKLFIFPFSCYYSFFANSSGLIYLSVLTAANSVFGLYFLLKSSAYLNMFNLDKLILIYCLISVTASIFSMISEKNIKIIFGYLISIINSLFLYFALVFDWNYILIAFFSLNLAVFIICSIFVLKNKMSFKRALLKKNKGFILEKAHILIFETFIQKLSDIIQFIDSKIIQNILDYLFKLFSYLSYVFVNATTDDSAIRNSKNVIIIFVAITLFAIFVTLIRGF